MTDKKPTLEYWKVDIYRNDVADLITTWKRVALAVGALLFLGGCLTIAYLAFTRY